MPIRAWAPVNDRSDEDEDEVMGAATNSSLLNRNQQNDQVVKNMDMQTTPPNSSDARRNSIKIASGKQKSRKPGDVSKKYSTFPASTPDAKIFAADPDLISAENLYRLAKRYTMAEIARKIQTNHPDTTMNQPTLSNRLARAQTSIAERLGVERDVVVEDLRRAQKAHGLTMNGRRVGVSLEEAEVIGEKGEEQSIYDARRTESREKKINVHMEKDSDEKDKDCEVEDYSDDEAADRFYVPDIDPRTEYFRDNLERACKDGNAHGIFVVHDASFRFW